MDKYAVNPPRVFGALRPHEHPVRNEASRLIIETRHSRPEGANERIDARPEHVLLMRTEECPSRLWRHDHVVEHRDRLLAQVFEVVGMDGPSRRGLAFVLLRLDLRDERRRVSDGLHSGAQGMDFSSIELQAIRVEQKPVWYDVRERL